MTTKGEQTRRNLLAEAATLFNQRGYQAASLSDVMDATQLKKGGIYRHFESKEALMLAAFEYAVELMSEQFREALRGKTTARGKLDALSSVYARIPSHPPVPGGCPVLNAAVEADDASPALKAAVCRTMTGLRGFIEGIVVEGQERGEFIAELDPEAISAVLVAQLEGAVMLCKLQDSEAPMQHTLRHLRGWFASFASPSPQRGSPQKRPRRSARPGSSLPKP